MTPTLVDRRDLLAMTAAAAILPLHVSGQTDARAGIAMVLSKFRRAYEAVDGAALERVLADDIVFSDPTFHHAATGLAEMRKMIAESAPQFHSIRLNVEHELVAPPWAVVRQEQVLVRKSPSAPAGITIRVRGVSLFRIEGGLIKEWHDYYDAAGYEKQLRAGGSPQ